LSMCNGSHRPAEAQSKQTRTSQKKVRGAGSALKRSDRLAASYYEIVQCQAGESRKGDSKA
jgi:hypothetical protein